MTEIWTKDKIKSLGMKNKEMWFDVLNHGLIEDRGYCLTISNIDQIKTKIKKDYINYLKSCAYNNSFYGYYILRNDSKIIVSVCRVVIIESQCYLEGLETHRDYYRKGFALKLILEVLNDLKKNNIEKLFSVVRKHNMKSLTFHKKCGFIPIKQNETNITFSIDVKNKLQ